MLRTAFLIYLLLFIHLSIFAFYLLTYVFFCLFLSVLTASGYLFSLLSWCKTNVYLDSCSVKGWKKEKKAEAALILYFLFISTLFTVQWPPAMFNIWGIKKNKRHLTGFFITYVFFLKKALLKIIIACFNHQTKPLPIYSVQTRHARGI